VAGILSRIPLVRRFVAPRFSADDVRDLWTAACAHFATRVLDPSDPKDMKHVGEALVLLGVADRRTFLERCTLAVADAVYLPFAPGAPTRDWPAWRQVLACARAHEVVSQAMASGFPGFQWLYYSNHAKRGMVEARALIAASSVDFRYRRTLPDPDRAAADLYLYGCTAADVDAAARLMEATAPAIRRGEVQGDAAGWVVGWLEARRNL